MKLRFVQFLVPAATILVLTVNYLAAARFINGRDPKTVSDMYPTGITPAGYAFTIWGLIYLGMIGFSIYQLLPSQKSDIVLQRVRYWYLAVSSANIAWIFTWHYDLIPLSMIFMLALLFSLAAIGFEIKAMNSLGALLLVRFPFSLYFGWVTVAAILNAAVTLVYFNVTVSEFAGNALGALVVGGVTIIGSVLRFRLDSMAYPLTIAWGVTAIGIEQSGRTLLVVTCAISLMTLLFFALWGYVKDR